MGTPDSSSSYRTPVAVFSPSVHSRFQQLSIGGSSNDQFVLAPAATYAEASPAGTNTPEFGTPAPISQRIDFDPPVRRPRRRDSLLTQQQLHEALHFRLPETSVLPDASHVIIGDTAVDLDIMARAFHQQYDGTPGIEGLNHLAEFDKHVRQYPPNAACPAVRVRTEVAWLAHSYEAHSPFETWCVDNLFPIIADLEIAISAGDQTARQAAASQASADFAQAKSDFKTQFCRSNSKDLYKLLTVDFQQASSLIDVIKTINKCSTLYSVNAGSLPNQADVVELVVDKLPTALQSKVNFGLAQLPDTPNNPRHTFKNVSTILQQLTQSRDSLLWLHFGAAGAGAAAAAAGAAAASSSTGTGHLDFNNLLGGSSAVSSSAWKHAPSASASDIAFAHLSDVDKCRALAVVSPHGMCPVHKDSPHALKDCPFVIGTHRHGRPSRRPTSDAHAALADVESEPDTTDKLSEMLQHMVFDSVSQAFAAHSGGGYHAPAPMRNQYGGQDARHFSKGAQQSGFRQQYPACDVCHAASHPTGTCWVIRPDKCQDNSLLVAHYHSLPAECKPLFVASLKRFNMYEALAPQLQATGPDAYPPRPEGSSSGPNNGPRSYFTLAGCPSTVAEVSGSPISVATACDADAQVQSISMAAATQPNRASIDPAIEMCNACGHPCDCKISVAHDSIGQMLWHCPRQLSGACTAYQPVSADHVLHACVAQYAGPLPAGFTQGEAGKCNGMAVTRAQAQQQIQQGPRQVSAPANRPQPAAAPQRMHAPVPPVMANSSRATPSATPSHISSQPSSSAGAGPSNSTIEPVVPKRGPVSFAPGLPQDPLTGISVPSAMSSRGEGKPVGCDGKGWVVLPFDATQPVVRRMLGTPAVGANPAAMLAAVFTGQADVHYDAAAFSSLTPAPGQQAFSTTGPDFVRFRELRGGVCRLAQPEGRPQDCAFIVVERDSGSNTLALPRVTFADSCSDNCFMRRRFAVMYGIACVTAPDSMLHMRTVGGVVSKPTVTTELVLLVFRWGTSQEHHVRCNFIVIDDDALPYDIILGTPILRLLACAIDFLTDTIEIRPKYVVNGDRSTAFSLPIVTTEQPLIGKRSAVVEPAVATTQSAFTDPDVPVAVSAAYQPGQPLFSTCCSVVSAMPPDAMDAADQPSDNVAGGVPDDAAAAASPGPDNELPDESLLDGLEDDDYMDEDGAEAAEAGEGSDEEAPPPPPAAAPPAPAPPDAAPHVAAAPTAPRPRRVPIPAPPAARPSGSTQPRMAGQPPPPATPSPSAAAGMHAPALPRGQPPPPPRPPPPASRTSPLPFGLSSGASSSALGGAAGSSPTRVGGSGSSSGGAGSPGQRKGSPGAGSSSAAGQSGSYLDAAAPMVFPDVDQLPAEARGIPKPSQAIAALVQGIMAALASGGQGAVVGIITVIVHFALYVTMAMHSLAPAVRACLPMSPTPGDLRNQLSRLATQLTAIAAQGDSMLGYVVANTEGDFNAALTQSLHDGSLVGPTDPAMLSIMQEYLYGHASIDAQPPDAWLWCQVCGFVPSGQHHLCVGQMPPFRCQEPHTVLDRAAAAISDMNRARLNAGLGVNRVASTAAEMLRGVQSSLLPRDVLCRMPSALLNEIVDIQMRVVSELRAVQAKAQPFMQQPIPPPRPPPGSPPSNCKGGNSSKRPLDEPFDDNDDDGSEQPLISRRLNPGVAIK